MRLLVLGGTRFVGRAVVSAALDREWDVTAIHRGVTGALPVGVAVAHADRTSEAALAAAIGDGQWDAVIDTWSGAPAVAGIAARLLRDRATSFGYVSSGSVYVWGEHVDEQSPLLAGDPRAEAGDYPDLKRGAELAILEQFPDALLSRAGLILGPHEDIGRLPWWLERISRGGRVVAPGRPERPLQYVDARDLAAWMLTALVDGVTGPVDVVSRGGHTTMGGLLSACVQATGSDAELVWVPESDLAAAGAEPWTQLPCWAPESGEFAAFMKADASLAAETGLVCRPVAETVEATWEWLSGEGPAAQRDDRPVHGLPPELEQQLLASH